MCFRSLLMAMGFVAGLAGALPAADLIANDDNNVYKFDFATGTKTVINTNANALYSDVTADTVGGVYVVDNNNGVIVGMTDTGAALPGFTTITPPGNYWPQGITFSRSTNQITIAGSLNSSPLAALYYSTSGAAAGTSAFNMPAVVLAMAYDSNNNLYSTSTGSKVVSKNGSTFVTLPGGGLTVGYYLATDTTGVYVSWSVIGTSMNISKYDFSGNLDPSFTTITGPDSANFNGLVVHDGVLYASSRNSISKYDPITGALIQANWATGNPGTSGSFFFRGLTVANVPEPSTYVLGVVATGVIAFISRRRKASRA